MFDEMRGVAKPHRYEPLFLIDPNTQFSFMYNPKTVGLSGELGRPPRRDGDAKIGLDRYVTIPLDHRALIASDLRQANVKVNGRYHVLILGRVKWYRPSAAAVTLVPRVLTRADRMCEIIALDALPTDTVPTHTTEYRGKTYALSIVRYVDTRTY